MLEIKDLHAVIEGDGTPILKGVNLRVNRGERHAIMGLNGAGKSTLAKVLAGHPAYEITSGEVWFKGQNLLEMEPEKRAHLGLFMGFQYPVEIPGVSNRQFLELSVNATRKANELPPMTKEEFDAFLAEKMKLMNIPTDFSCRNLNEGFSGGEKKRNEILQMALLNPDLAVLDETDSGLDIDAMKVVAHGVNTLFSPEKGLILITHYQRLLNYIKPDFVHIMLEGQIVATGGAELALEVEERGYEWLARGAAL
jgi:Fe-S cluster assembly ATP-binding protein